MPPGIELTSAKLTIEFHGTEDFLRLIGAVIYALHNDFEAMRDFIEGDQL